METNNVMSDSLSERIGVPTSFKGASVTRDMAVGTCQTAETTIIGHGGGRPSAEWGTLLLRCIFTKFFFSLSMARDGHWFWNGNKKIEPSCYVHVYTHASFSSHTVLFRPSKDGETSSQMSNGGGPQFCLLPLAM